MRLLAAAALIGMMTGCTEVPKYIRDVDVSGREPSCVQICRGPYDACSGRGGGGNSLHTMEGCKSSYRRCVDACPEK